MANTTVNADNIVEQWSKKFYREWVRALQFNSLMGMEPNAPIQVNEELGKEAGEAITLSLVTRLQGNGVTGDNTLRGNEEAIGNYGHKITIDQLRNAVRIGKMEQKRTHIQMMDVARPLLKDWRMNAFRDEVIAVLQSPNVDGTTPYASCSEAQKDAWLAANSDRVLFGAAKSNNSSNDHSASLLSVDSTTDVVTGSTISLAKRMAKTADPHMRPVTVDKKGEWYVWLMGSLAFRDLKSDLKSEHEAAGVRGKDNPIFVDGDLMWDGMIIKEVPEIPVISGVGNGGIDVAPNFLLGAQGVGYAIGEATHAISEEQDYKNLRGKGVAETRGIDKLMYNSIQHGVLTYYSAGVADS